MCRAHCHSLFRYLYRVITAGKLHHPRIRGNQGEGDFNLRLQRRGVFRDSHLVRFGEILHSSFRFGALLDIGANLGDFGSFFASKYRLRVISFEPNPTLIPVLRSRYLQLSLEREVFPLALSDRAGSSGFSFDTSHTGGGRLSDEVRRGGEQVFVVEVSTLDEVAPRLSLPHSLFLKVDIEGHESRFLAGARATVRAFRPVFCIEISSNTTERDMRDCLEDYTFWSLRIPGVDYEADPLVRSAHLLKTVFARSIFLERYVFGTQSAGVFCIPDEYGALMSGAIDAFKTNGIDLML